MNGRLYRIKMISNYVLFLSFHRSHRLSCDTAAIIISFNDYFEIIIFYPRRTVKAQMKLKMICIINRGWAVEKRKITHVGNAAEQSKAIDVVPIGFYPMVTSDSLQNRCIRIFMFVCVRGKKSFAINLILFMLLILFRCFFFFLLFFLFA